MSMESQAEPASSTGGFRASTVEAPSLLGRREAGPGDDDSVEVGEVVGRYQVRRLLGEGGMGRVYLARDMTLGRSVAVKMVRRDHLGGGSTARFIEEARTIAALNHPNIVQLYDVGEHRGALFLALEYIDGETLRERMSREPCSADEGLRIARAIAEALVHAHAAGICHCDLKPSNVMLGRDGRLRVVDFGLARSELSPSRQLAGTPEWMAPEQWTGDPPSNRVDVWALAIVTAQLLTGKHPIALTETRPLGPARLATSPLGPVDTAQMPPVLVELVMRSLSHEPSLRPSATEWFQCLDHLIEGDEAGSLEEGPFRGLAPFQERHARFYFGREREIDAFLEELRGSVFLPIVGATGVGKSSFLHAGVLPRLRARERHVVIAFRPGRQPLQTLVRHLLAAGQAAGAGVDAHEAERLVEELRATPRLLAARLATLAAAQGGRVIVAVDQLEEVFTQSDDAVQAQRFIELLLGAADDPLDPVRVVVTMRDDFLGRIGGLRSLFVLRHLDRDDLRRTILSPLARYGYQVDDARVVDAMLDELGHDVVADLPVLQFACRSLWEARDPQRRLLLRSWYDSHGGVAGALARHADGVLAELPVPARTIVRQMLLRLVNGTTRRTVERASLLADLPDEAGEVLDRLLASRLLVQGLSAEGAGVMVEIAHESLLRHWDQLARWMDESHEERRLIAELEEAARFWARRGRRPEETWSFEDLTAARRRVAQLAVVVPPGASEFLAAGEARHLAQRRRTRRRRVGLGIVAALVTLGSLLLASEFRRQKLAAQEVSRSLWLAHGNFGQIDLRLEPFDREGGQRRPVDAHALPELSFSLYGARAGDPHRPGARLAPDLVRERELIGAHDTARRFRVEAPGGATFLRIDGRGRAGERCPPSWLRLQSLPGYSERDRPVTMTVLVPTCQASRSDLVDIEAGPFVYGGPGEPPTSFAGYVEPEETVWLPAFAIDRTEVSNAAFRDFAELAAITGYAVPAFPTDPALRGAGEPDHPVAAVDAYEAEAYCRFLGKRLPGDLEWTKAARGGVRVGGVANPYPRRLFPWGASAGPGCANLAGSADGFDWTAPVDALACGASPYGVLNLAGNVSEWISREGQRDVDRPLRVVRGGAADSPGALQQGTTVFRNEREGRNFSFAIGFRCAVSDTNDEGDPWARQ